MPTGKLSSFDLTTGVPVDMSEAVYLLSPVDTPLITGFGGDGLSVLSTENVEQIKVEWMDEEILTPKSTLAVNVVTAGTEIVVAAGDQLKFSTGDVLMLGAAKERVKVTGYSATTADTLLVTRAFNTTPAATTHATSDTVIGLGTALAEGSDPENARAKDRTSRYNLTQIFGPTAVHMTRTEAKRPKYGNRAAGGNWTRELLFRTKENTISREQAILYGTRYESTTEEVRTMGGLHYYINSQGNVDSTTTQLTATAIQTNLQTNYNAGAVPDRIIANPARFVSLTDVGTVTTILESRTATVRGRAPATQVLTQFGPVSLVPDRWAHTAHAFAIIRSNVSRGIFDPLMFEWLAKTGDAKKGQLVGEETLIVRGAQQMTLFSGLTS